MTSEQNDHSNESRASPSSSGPRTPAASRQDGGPSRRERIKALRARIEKLIDRTAPAGCHLWLGERTESGLPKIVADDGQRFIVTRFVFGRYIPRGWHLTPTCGRAACCNPAHLVPVPYKPNLKRRRTRLRRLHDPGKV